VPEARREIVRWIADRLTVVTAAWLAAGLALSALVWLVCVGVVYALWLSIRGLRTAESSKDDR
jgi:hypothetical protein